MKIKLVIILSLAISVETYADSATWNLNPTSNDWDTAANWTPNSVPDGSDDDATFDQSNTTDVVVGATELVRNLIFAPDADPFTITVNARRTFSLLDGIVNDSGSNQTLVALADPGGRSGTITFDVGARAGTMMTIITQGNFVANLGNGGLVLFNASASAEANTFINRGATVDAGFGGRIIFFGSGANAAQSTITNEAGTVTGADGGFTSFDTGASAATSVIVAEGATVLNAFGGVILLSDGADAGTASLTAEEGSNGGRGGRVILGDITGSGQVEINGNGILDVGRPPAHPSTVGSLTGDGTVKLSARRSREIGSNNLSTTFSGTIQDGGIITKIGTGTFTLAGTNTYTGGTTVTSGVLLVSNASGSGTGTGAVTVNGGTLGVPSL
jgi:autotransporter-associated beta strand protein